MPWGLARGGGEQEGKQRLYQDLSNGASNVVRAPRDVMRDGLSITDYDGEDDCFSAVTSMDRFRVAAPPLPALGVVGSGGEWTSEVPTSEVPTSEVTTSEVPTSEVTASGAMPGQRPLVKQMREAMDSMYVLRYDVVT